MANELEKKYSVLIEQAITDFDAIFNALANKSVVFNKKVLGTEGAMVDDGIATSKYAELISGQLYKIDGTVANTNGVVANKAGATVAVSEPGVAYNTNGNVVVSGALSEAGYYNTTSSASATLVGKLVTLSGGTPAKGEGYTLDSTDASKYVIAPENGNIINKIEVDKGSAVVNLQQDNVTATLVSNAAVEGLGEDSTATTAKLVDADGTVPTGSYTVTFKAQSSYSGSVVATNGTTLTPGYITALTKTKESVTKEIAVTAGNSADYTIAIPKATITGITGSGTASLKVPSGIVTYDPNKEGVVVPDDAYEIKAEGTIRIDSGSAQITEGYIKQSDGISVNASGSGVSGQTLYIKKGSLGTAELNKKEDIAITISDVDKDDELGKYVATATVNQTYSKDIVDGYIPESAKTFSATLSGSNTLALDVATATVTTTGTAMSGNGDSIFSTKEIKDGKHYTVTASTEFGKEFKAGYLGASAELVVPAKQTGTHDIWVASGSVTPSVNLSTVLKTGSTDDGEGGSTAINIFESTPDTTRDYYEVSAVPSVTVSAGYVDGGTITGNASQTAKSYLPKAVLKYVVNEDDPDSTKFIEVQKGGYLPSGVITDITDIIGTPDYANVTVGIENNFGSTLNAGTDYTLSLQRSATDAGYISATNGSIALDKAYTIAHGAATLNGSNTVEIPAAPVLGENGTYTFTASGNATATFALTKEGYLKIGDVTSSATGSNWVVDSGSATLKLAGSAPLVLNKAALNIKDGSKITLGEDDAKTVQTSPTETKYYVKPKIVSNSVVAEVGTAGYLADSDTVSLNISAADATIYIKEGAALTNVANTTADSVVEISDEYAKAGSNYVFTLPSYDILVSGTLAEGYYGADIKNVTGKATVAAKTLTLESATATVSQTDTSVGLASADPEKEITLYAANTESGKEFASIKATATAAVEVTLNKEGYISDKSQVTVNDITIAPQTKYIEILKEGRKDIEGVTYNTITVGGQDESNVNELEVDLPTAGKYALHNTKVILHEDAMGSAVEANLKKLESRLAGTYSKSAA